MFLSKKTLSLAIAFIPVQAIAQDCLNSDTFTYPFDGKDRTCRNIRFNGARREALCPIAEVSAACPQTCGECCEDVEGYTFTRNNGMEGDCAWLGAKDERKERYCDDLTVVSDGRTVRDGCSKTCDFCFDPPVYQSSPNLIALVKPVVTTPLSHRMY